MASKPSNGSPEYEWMQVTEKAAFAPRDGAGALVFGGRMWLLGGWNRVDKTNFPRVCNNEVWSSQDGADWTLEKPGTFGNASFDPATDWEGRHCAGYAVFQDRMWIVGGDTNQGHYHYDVWNSVDGKTWNHVNQGHRVPWGPRALYYTCVFRDRIWVLGGQTMPSFAPAGDRFYDDVWNTQDGIDWERVVPRQPYWPQRGLIGGSVVFQDRMWVLGGGTYDTPGQPERKYYNDVWSSADGVNWECHLENAPWSRRQFHETAVFDDRMWVMEGALSPDSKDIPDASDVVSRHPDQAGWISLQNSNDVWYSADGVNWSELPNTPWAPRHAASVFVYDNALWMVAGNNMDSDVWKLVRARQDGDSTR
jgi:hypothetical protein